MYIIRTIDITCIRTWVYNDDDEEEDDIDNHKIHKSANYYKRQEEKAKLKSLINKVKELQKDEEQKYFDEKQKL